MTDTIRPIAVAIDAHVQADPDQAGVVLSEWVVVYGTLDLSTGRHASACVTSPGGTPWGHAGLIMQGAELLGDGHFDRGEEA